MSKDAIAARWKRARQGMVDRGFDALLVTEKYNYWYFTGHLSREPDKKMRPMLCLIPANGEPVVVVYRQAEKAVRRSAPVSDVLTYEDVPFPVELIAEAIEMRGLNSARIGAEFGPYERMGLGQTQFQEAKRMVPSARFEDASSVFEKLRTIKMADEIEAIREACALSLRAWDDAVGHFVVGMKNSDLKRVLSAALIQQGSDFDIAGHVTMGNGIHGIEPYQPGHTIWSDFGGTCSGYQGDIARRAVFGRPTRDQLDDHARIFDILEEEIRAIKPGVRACDVARATSDALEKHGYKPLGAKKRVGHGVGLCAAEAPSLSLADETILAPGMVLTPEPRFDLPTGERIHIEEVVVVTENGSEKLTSGAEKLAVIG